MEAIPKEVGNLVVMVNCAVVGGALVAAGAWLAHGRLSATEPTRRQHAGEATLAFFVGKAEAMAPSGEKREKVIRIVVPFLAAFFMFIIASNLIAILPVPVINRPPTSHFSATLTLALLSVVGTLIISASGSWRGSHHQAPVLAEPAAVGLRVHRHPVAVLATVRQHRRRVHDARAGERSSRPSVSRSILHALGLIPAFVQALVFTLLTASFIATAIQHDEKKAEQEATDPVEVEEAPLAPTFGRLKGIEEV